MTHVLVIVMAVVFAYVALRSSSMAMFNSTVTVWDATNGEGIVVLRDHERQVITLAFSPNSQRIVSTSYDRVSQDGIGQVLSVFSTTQDLIDHAKSIAPRELTPCERERFFL